MLFGWILRWRRKTLYAELGIFCLDLSKHFPVLNEISYLLRLLDFINANGTEEVTDIFSRTILEFYLMCQNTKERQRKEVEEKEEEKEEKEKRKKQRETKLFIASDCFSFQVYENLIFNDPKACATNKKI